MYRVTIVYYIYIFERKICIKTDAYLAEGAPNYQVVRFLFFASFIKKQIPTGYFHYLYRLPASFLLLLSGQEDYCLLYERCFL